MARGRFKGWKGATTIAKMSEADKQKYYDFLEAVEKARAEGTELPEPPVYESLGEKNGQKQNKTTAKETATKSESSSASSGTQYTRHIHPMDKGEDLKDEFEDVEEDAEDEFDSEEETEESAEEPTEESTEDRKIEDNEFISESQLPNWAKENMAKYDMAETIIHHCAREEFCIIETNERFWKERLMKMHEKYPDLVIYIKKWCIGGMVRVKIPYKFMKKVKVSKKTAASDKQKEQRKAFSNLVKKMWSDKKEEQEETTEGTEQATEQTTEETTEQAQEEQKELENKSESIIVPDEPVLEQEDEKEKYSGGPALKEAETKDETEAEKQEEPVAQEEPARQEETDEEWEDESRIRKDVENAEAVDGAVEEAENKEQTTEQAPQGQASQEQTKKSVNIIVPYDGLYGAPYSFGPGYDDYGVGKIEEAKTKHLLSDEDENEDDSYYACYRDYWG